MLLPICLRLPQEPDLACALWRLFALGSQQAQCSRLTRLRDEACWQALLLLIRHRLLAGIHCERCVWVERRELRDLLLTLDAGLDCLFHNGGSQLQEHTTLQAVRQFLQAIPEQILSPRKPARREMATVAEPLSVPRSASAAS